MKHLALLSLLYLLSSGLCAQQQPDPYWFGCGTDELRAALQNGDPEYAQREKAQEAAYRDAITSPKKGAGGGVLTLPVVVHIIHDNGPENIPDAQVLKGLALLNDAFRNRNYFNPATGVDTEIEFCLAQRDLTGKTFSGIARYQSPLTDMSLKLGAPYTLTQWDTKNYINIILVREACLFGDCSGVAGYATLPGTHGQPGEGIVMEAKYFGTTPREAVVITHEMGHYLGLMHTFQDGCKNDNCLTDGDRVCDTPPDNSTGYFPCDASINSCHTDADDPSANNPFRSIALGGLGDQPDQHRNYMDYSIYECYDRFSEGQKQRMRFFVEGIRASLLASKACLLPCPAEVLAKFTVDKDSVAAGGTMGVVNQTLQAAGYQWYINGQLASTAKAPVFTFDYEGDYTIRLEASSALAACDPGIFKKKIKVFCPVSAAFDYWVKGKELIVKSKAVQADSLRWALKDGAGKLLFQSNAPTDTFDLSGLQYVQLCLLAKNSHCERQSCTYIKLIANGIEICNNGLDDDEDGLTDRFDPDCPCDTAYYQAYCPVDCEYVPNPYPDIPLKLKWTSEVLADFWDYSPTIVTGDIDGDGDIEVITPKTVGDWTLNNVKNTTIILDGTTGNTNLDFTFTALNNLNSQSMISIADVNGDGKAEIFSLLFNTILCYSPDGVLLWESEPLQDQSGRQINITDFNADGIPELYVGNQILNAQNGKLLASGSATEGCNKSSLVAYPVCAIKHTIAADLLPTPGLELAAGNTVYQVTINNPNGTLGNSMVPVTATGPVTDGFTSVGDINGDGQLDVVVVRDKTYPDGGGIWVWDPRTRATIASANAGRGGGVALIGNVYGDCRPEIGMTFEKELRMYQYDGSPQLKLLYNLPTTDRSGITGITIFDFNQDGKQELVYRDETTLRILEGAAGKTLASYPVRSPTWMEYPIVADVDGDGHAELLVGGYQSGLPFDHRVYCFESAGLPWAPARSVWNQYGYHVTNVNDDLTIPRHPQNPATPLPGYETCLQPTCPAPYNAFMAQATYRTQQGCVQFPAVDLELKVLRYECSPDSLIFYLVLRNLSTKKIGKKCLDLSCYPFLPPSGQMPPPLEAICFPITEDPVLNDTIRLASLIPSGVTQMYFIINDAGHGANPFNYPTTGIIECNYVNNKDYIKLDIAPRSLDLGPDVTKCRNQPITLNAGAGFETYRWSDGSVDSIYSSGQPGLHILEATDHCHRVYRDTVLLSIDALLDVHLGPDIAACQGEALDMSVPGDYDYRYWQPAEKVGCSDCPQVSWVADTSFSLILVAGKAGCFSADTVNIAVAPLLQRSLAYSLCAGDSVRVAGQWLSGAGSFSLTAAATTGCDTVFSVNILELPVLSRTDTLRICHGDSVSVFGQWVLKDAVLSKTFQSAKGCDSLQTYRVMAAPLLSQSLNYSLCAGDSVRVAGQWLSGAGSFSLTAAAATGCDTVFSVKIVEIPAVSRMDTLHICHGDSVSIFGQWVLKDAVLSKTFQSAKGCDSLQTYRVLAAPLSSQSLAYTLCAGDSVRVAGQWLSGAGSFSLTAAGATGCDTVFSVKIVEIPAVSRMDTLRICQGDSVSVFGQWVLKDAVLSKTFQSAKGCDSLQTYRVLAAPLLNQSLAYTLCAGDSVRVAGQWLSGAGSFSLTAAGATGCDTVFSVNILELPVLSRTDTLHICQGDSVSVFGQWVLKDAVLSKTFQSAQGCDSLQTYRVLAAPLLSQSLAYSLCAGDSVRVAGQWLSGAGSFSLTAAASSGCDTVFFVKIVEIPAVSRMDTLHICQGDSVSIFGQWVLKDAVLSKTFQSAQGCDSLQTYRVLAAPLLNQSLAYTLCAGDSVRVAGQWLSGAGSFSLTAAGATGCDTVFSVKIVEIPTVSHTDTLQICQGDSVNVFGQWVLKDAVLSKTFQSAQGCDSLQTYRVLAAPLLNQSLNYSLCAGDSVRVAGQWLSGAGSFSLTAAASSGCDTVFFVKIVEIPAVSRMDTLHICQGDSVSVFGQWVLKDAVLSKTFQSAKGCDSLQTYRVMAAPLLSQSLAYTLCAGDSVRVAGQWLSGAGSFDLIAHSATSCDTLFSVNIVEIPDMPIPPNPGNQLILTNQGLLLNSNADPAMWKVRWQPSDLFSCDTCLKTMLHAPKDTTLEVTYSHRFGCGEYSYPFRVILAQHSDFFIPNVFSPNGDGRNDFWTVVPPAGIFGFEEVSIWDRWGSLLARWHDAPEIRWDGIFRGQALNPGVFVYYFRYTNAKGEKVEKKGDVSIVR